MTDNSDNAVLSKAEYSKFSEKVISSGFGALLTSFVVTPLDVIKTRLQAQHKTFSNQKCFLYYNGLWDHVCFCNDHSKNNLHENSHVNHTNCVWYKRPGHFNGTADAFVKIIKYEGITSLWSGLPPTLVMAVPATILYFTVYDHFQEYVCHRLNTTHPPLWAPCIAGVFARILTVSAVSPIELIRTKMQAGNVEYASILKAVRKVIKQRGIISLWHGWSPTIMRDVPFSVIYWSVYESAKKYNTPQPSIFYSFLSGAAAGTIAAIITLPFDVAKTYRQVELGEADILKGKKTSTSQVLLELYKKKGFTVLFTGLLPRIIKIAPACAIMISSYEYGKKYFLKKQMYTNND